jgi:hypothetical protein
MRHCSVGTERPVPVVHALRVAAALRRGKHHSRTPFNVGGCKESRRVRGWTARRAAPVRYLAPRIHSRRGRLPSSRLRRRAEAHQLKTLPALLAPGADPPRYPPLLMVTVLPMLALLLGDIPRAAAAHSHDFSWVAFAPRSRSTTRAYRPQQRPPQPMARQRLCSEHPDVEAVLTWAHAKGCQPAPGPAAAHANSSSTSGP